MGSRKVARGHYRGRPHDEANPHPTGDFAPFRPGIDARRVGPYAPLRVTFRVQCLKEEHSSDKWTIPVGIAGFSSMTGTRWELLMAACVLTILPVVIVVALAQRQLVAAIGAGAFGGR